jgi:dTDP-glucose pyrophosphorylase
VARLQFLDDLVCPPDTSIRGGLARLNATADLFQLVVDADRRLLGTLTDGDIRRALLAGFDMSDSVASAMQIKPVSAPAADVAGAHKLLSNIRSLVPFVPLIDEDGRVTAVFVQRRNSDGNVAALVMAGGKGTRLGSLTQSIPKPLVEVGGKPILEHVLTGLEAGGVEDIYVSVNHFGEQIDRYCQQRNGSAKLHILWEDAPGGTAGALGLLPKDLDRPLLVINGDLVTEMDFRAMEAFFEAQHLAACIAVAHHEIMIPYGVVSADADGIFRGIQEKPVVKSFVAAGIYMLDETVYRLVKHGRRIDMPDLLNEARSAGLKIGVFPLHEYWRDVGHPADLAEADADLRAGAVSGVLS